MAGENKSQGDLASIRDTVESVWVAIILAFVLRAFMVEAFVIPTGSMAPRLMGEHLQMTCPACGYEYAFGGARPTQESANPVRRILNAPEPQLSGARCPNCRRPSDAGPQYLSGGDRVLVMKYLYRFSPPSPWDVVVFRNPQNNRENYIKRLIGLPGETIEIVHGDIFVSKSPTGPREIRRKPAPAQEAMWQTVFDNDYQIDRDYLRRADCPQWEAQPAGGWELSEQGRAFTAKASPEARELVLRPTGDTFLPRYGYNPEPGEMQFVNRNSDICTDLKLSATFKPRSDGAGVAMILSSFENCFRAEIAPDGAARLMYQPTASAPDSWKELAAVKLPPFQAGRCYQLAMANVDLSLRLWVDGREVLRVTDGYPMTPKALKQRMEEASIRPVPQPEVRVQAWGAESEICHLSLMRDVYYTFMPTSSAGAGDLSTPLGDFAARLGVTRGSAGWGTTGHPITLAEHPENHDLDEFYVLGDNSPMSLDSRAWMAASPTLALWKHPDQRHTSVDFNREDALYKLGTVPRYNLIGKAFFVYWPAGFRPPALPGLPLVPNVGKMRLIR
ncbi:MAG: signal peptidase I [Phycisphaerae bacterium]|jgi:signal peptidase I